MIFSWFDVRAEKEFGKSLATFFIERASREYSTKNKRIEKTDELFKKMALQIAQFKREHKLNIYKKAQVGNSFKWTLRDAGFAPEFIDHLTTNIMLEL